MYLRDDAAISWKSIDIDEMLKLPDEEYEKVFIDRWSHGKKDKESTRGLFSFRNFLLHVHGCLQQEKVIKVGRALSPGTLKVVIENSRTE